LGRRNSHTFGNSRIIKHIVGAIINLRGEEEEAKASVHEKNP
jgi:hypothetical protein